MGRRARGKRGKPRKTRLSEDVLLISLSRPTPQKQRDRGHAGGEGLVIIGRLCTQEKDQQVGAHHTQVRCWWGQRTKQTL